MRTVRTAPPGCRGLEIRRPDSLHRWKGTASKPQTALVISDAVPIGLDDIFFGINPIILRISSSPQIHPPPRIYCKDSYRLGRLEPWLGRSRIQRPSIFSHHSRLVPSFIDLAAPKSEDNLALKSESSDAVRTCQPVACTSTIRMQRPAHGRIRLQPILK